MEVKQPRHWDSALVIGIICGIIIVTTAMYLVIMSVTRGYSQGHEDTKLVRQEGEPLTESKKVDWMKRCVVMPDTPNNPQLAQMVRRNPTKYPKGYPSVTVTGPNGTITKDLPLCCTMCYNRVMGISTPKEKKKGDNLKKYTRNLMIRIAQGGSSGI